MEANGQKNAYHLGADRKTGVELVSVTIRAFSVCLDVCRRGGICFEVAPGFQGAVSRASEPRNDVLADRVTRRTTMLTGSLGVNSMNEFVRVVSITLVDLLGCYNITTSDRWK